MAFYVIGKQVLKSMFSKPATAMYPIVKNEFYPITRGRIELSPVEDCIYCGICSKRCPADAIEVVKADKKWEIDRTRCIVCNFCVQLCPKKCLSAERQYTSPMTDKTKRFSTFYGEVATTEDA